MNLIMQVYLNLSRNDENLDRLVQLKLFSRVRILLEKYLDHEEKVR